MCDLLTFAVPAGKQVPPPPVRARDRWFTIERHHNQGGGHAYGEGFDAYAVLVGMCSCGLIGAECPSEDTEDQLAKRRAKYRRKGWSEAKIERAISEHVAAHERVGPSDWRGLRPDVASYFVEVCKRAGQLRFITHAHHGLFVSEPFAVSGPNKLSLDELAAGAPHMNSGRLYIVRPSP